MVAALIIVGIFRHVAVEAISDFDLEVLSSDMAEELLCLRFAGIDDRHDLEVLVKRDRNSSAASPKVNSCAKSSQSG